MSVMVSEVEHVALEATESDTSKQPSLVNVWGIPEQPVTVVPSPKFQVQRFDPTEVLVNVTVKGMHLLVVSEIVMGLESELYDVIGAIQTMFCVKVASGKRFTKGVVLLSIVQPCNINMSL
jgi:hypothetical protein